MRKVLSYIPIILCTILMAAHWSRGDSNILMIVTLIIPFILFWKNKIAVRVMQLLLVAYGIIWIVSIFHYIELRNTMGKDWIRLAIILGVVAFANFATALVFQTKTMKKLYSL